MSAKNLSDTLSHWLWQARSATVVYPIALLLASALIISIYPLSFLSGHGHYFAGGDPASHVSGWWFFKDEPWHFPVLLSTRFNAPEGISIAFADSIPLLAVLFKPFSDFLPEHFHYFGLWHAFSYLLQACSAVFLIRSLNVLHWPGAVIATAFAITWPALTHRFGHTALMSHGLLLLALAFYLKGYKEQWTVDKTALGFIVLSVLALLIHPYLLAMVYPVFAVFLVGQFSRRRSTLLQLGRWLLISLSTLLAVMYIGGYFIGKGATITGYGIYSLNLLAPWCGGMLCSSPFADPFLDEGFNYFGAGFLLLLAWTLIFAPMRAMAILKRHWPLLLLLIGFTLFALSNRIFMGSSALLEIPLNDRVMSALGVFRASARFFWLVGYAVLFAVLSLLLRRHTAMTLVLCGCALALQWYDTSMLRERVRAGVQAEGVDDLSGWRTTLAGMDQVLIYPAYGCANVHPYAYVGYQRIAAYLGLTVNTAYIARYTQNCEAANAFAQQPGEPGKLYVLAGFTFNPLDVPPLFQQLLRQQACAQRTDQLVCALGYRDKDWQAVAVPLSKDLLLSKQWPAAQLPTVIGHVVDDYLVAKSEADEGYLSYGPYITLPAGEYELQFDYLSQSPSDDQVGHWDMVAKDASNRAVIVAQGPVYGSESAQGLIKQPVRLDATMHDVELRLFKQGGPLALKSVGIRNVLMP